MSASNAGLKARPIDEIDDIERSCKSCLKLGSCWFVVSVKNALMNHQKIMGVTMLEWPELGKICTEYAHTDNPMRIVTDTNLER